MKQQPAKEPPKFPTMNPVESQGITAIGYDDATKELHIHFKNGGQYKYPDVSPEQYIDLMKAKSIGGHFMRMFRQARMVRLDKQQ